MQTDEISNDTWRVEYIRPMCYRVCSYSYDGLRCYEAPGRLESLELAEALAKQLNEEM